MSDCSANLPQELITNILICLPGKSIGRSRCVSKSWLSLLTSNEFIKAHLARHSHLAQEQSLFLLSSSNSLFTLALHPGRSLRRKLESFDEKLENLVGSCSGLVLAVTEEYTKCLINCLTEEYVKLPNSPLALDPHGSFSMHGFGYDRLSDDYKIVSLSYYNTDNEYEPDCVDTFVDIFSFKTRSWRRLGSSPYDHAVPEIASGVFVNGAIHWLGWKSNNTSVIAAFDLSSEKFQEIPAPPSLDKDKFVFYKLIEIEGCLGIVADIYSEEFVQIWFMNKYSKVESWTKISIDMNSMSWTPLCFHKDKLLILEDGENFMWYYPDEERWDNWMVNNDDHHDFDGEGENHGVVYSESLVSPGSLLESS